MTIAVIVAAKRRHIRFTVDKKRIPFFFVFFSYGIKVEVETGRTLRDVLCRQLGMDAAYVDNQVQTLFLNAKAVDDVDHARVDSGAAIALSAAMPGLAGAVLRKGGMLAAMRSQTPAPADAPEKQDTSGIVTVKLFNRVASDFGPAFLAKGIRVAGAHFNRFFMQNRETLAAMVRHMEINGKTHDVASVFMDAEPDGDIELTVCAA